MQNRGLPFALILLLCASAAVSQTNPRLEGTPKTLILTFKCAPSRRPALRGYMSRTGLKQLKVWKNAGILSDYRVLFSRYADSDSWDLMTILSFPDSTSLSRWKGVENRSPAGLSPPGLSIVASVGTTPADLTRSNFSGEDDRASVFLVVPYDYSVSTNEYIRYLDGYVVPQLNGWHEEGVLIHYDIFMARYGTARPWSSLLVLQYANEEALGARDRVVAKVRDGLKNDSSWKAFAENKQNVRVEKEAIVSDELR
jgi:hypothetical protein